MTTNQIAYENLQEAKRLNTLTTTETKRHNLATEQVGFGTLGETTRHNRMTESIDISKLGETARHNRASESIDFGKLSESVRTNKANEALRAGELSESNRHNVQVESETNRHNVQTEIQALKNMNLEYQKLSEIIQANRNSEEIRSEANKIQQSYNDAMARINFLNWNTTDSRNRVLSEVDRQKVNIMQEELKIAQKQMDLAYEKQDWTEFDSGANLFKDTFMALYKLSKK